MTSADRERGSAGSGPASEAGAEAIERGSAEATSRRDLLRTGGAAIVASVLGVLGVASATAARNGDAVRAGDRTTATKGTLLEASKGPAFQVKMVGKGEGVALRGSASSPKGIGVQGEATSEKGASIAVQGVAGSPEGVAGQFVAKAGGTGVEALASEKNGVALRTKGRVELGGRSGVASVSGGAEFVVPVAGGLSETSLVLATLQDHFPGVHVESASVLDTREGLIVVRLNQALPEPAKVGWLVLD